MEKHPEQNKTPYEALEMEVLSFETEDVITTSDKHERMQENDTQGMKFSL